MLKFRELTLEDKKIIDGVLEKHHQMGCEYCFGDNFVWRKVFNTRIAFFKDFYIIKLENDKDEVGTSFLYPIGEDASDVAVNEVIEEILAYCEDKNNNIDKFCLHNATLENVETLNKLFPNKFCYYNNRDFADYIYTVEDLAGLVGKKYHGKRNHIARFKENDWSFEEITKDNIQECMEMNKKWCEENNCAQEISLREECCAARVSIKYFDRLNLFGGLLRVDKKVVAYTIAEKLNSDTVVVHIEKAFSSIQGTYAAINNEFVKNMCKDYKYVNREDDAGVEGLRKAKLSYYPTMLIEKYGVILKNEE